MVSDEDFLQTGHGCAEKTNSPLHIERFKCGFCAKGFDAEDAFLLHLRAHHTERKKSIDSLKLEGVLNDVPKQRVVTERLSDYNSFTEFNLPFRKFIPVHKVCSNNETETCPRKSGVILDQNSVISDNKRHSSVSVSTARPIVKSECPIKEEPLEPEKDTTSFIKLEPPDSEVDIKCEPVELPDIKTEPVDPTHEFYLQEVHKVKLSGKVPVIPIKLESVYHEVPSLFIPVETETYFDCTECCFRGNTSEALADHMTALHSRKILQLIRERETTFYDCSDCHFRASSNSALQNHIRVLHNEITIKHEAKKNVPSCSQCSFVGQTEKDLFEHFETFHDSTNKPSKSRFNDCSQCCFRGQTAEALLKHVRALHPTTKRRKTVNCDRCSFVANSSIQLASHKTGHL